MTHLNKTLEFLAFSSKIVTIFNDNGPVSSLSDQRLAEMDQCLQWLNKWEEDANGCQELSKSARSKRMLSDKLQFDLKSTLIGFKEVCRISFENMSLSLTPLKLGLNLTSLFTPLMNMQVIR